MKSLSKFSIFLLLLSSVLVSFAIMQSFLEVNLFPEHLEAFFYGMVTSFGALTFFVFLAALISELSTISKELKSINNETN